MGPNRCHGRPVPWPFIPDPAVIHAEGRCTRRCPVCGALLLWEVRDGEPRIVDREELEPELAAEWKRRREARDADGL